MKIEINDVIVPNVKRGFVLNDRLDEELDSGTIIAINSQATPFLPFSVVKIYITSDLTPDHYFYVDSDQVTQLTKVAPFYYQHIIQVIELTKLLERYYVDNVGFTQPTEATGLTRYTLADVITRLNNITPLETNARHAATRLITIDPNLITDFNSKAPQFFFNTQNLLQVLAEIFKYTDGFPKITSFSQSTSLPLLQKTDFNKIVETIANFKKVNEVKNVDNEYFANNLETNIENGIAGVLEVFPAVNTYAPLTSDSFVITTNDFSIILPKPIYEIKKLSILLKYIDQTSNAQEAKFKYVDYDISDKVFETELYNALKVEDPNQPSKYGSLVYEKGKNKINGFGLAFPQLWGLVTETTINKILDDVNNIENGTYSTINEFASNGNMLLSGFIGFRVEYFPYMSFRASVTKQGSESNNNFSILVNQNSQNIDVNRLLSNSQATLNRVGNQELTIETFVPNYNDRFKVGQTTTDNYIVTTVENEIFEPAVKSKAILSKNFNRLSSFIGIDRDIRQYEIPFTEAINRNLKYQEYVVIDVVSNSGNSSGWSATQRGYLANTFNNLTPTTTITGVIVETKDHNNTSIGKFLLPITKSYYKNGNIFHFSFPNNTVAYYYPIREVGTVLGPISQKAFKRYTYWNNANDLDVNNGTFKFMTFELVDKNMYLATPDLCKPAVSSLAAIQDYINVQTSFPLGLFYYLPTAFTDVFNDSSRYVLAKQGLSESNPSLKAVTEFDVFYDLISNRRSFTNQPTSTSQPAYLQINPIYTYNQVEIPTLQIAGGRLLKGGLAYQAMRLEDLVVYKDPTETISMTYQLQFVSKKPFVIIGPTLTQHSPFIIDVSTLTLNERNMHLYRSTEYYREGEIKAKGDKTTTAFSNFTLNTSVTDGFSVSITTSLVGYNSWAIGDNNGNLYFAVNKRLNGTFDTTVFFQFKNTL